MKLESPGDRMFVARSRHTFYLKELPMNCPASNRRHVLKWGLALGILSASFGCGTSEGAEKKIEVTFSGGHEIGRDDFGRPVPLIAAALGVKPEVFRKAFSGVRPARGRGPSRDEAQKNKSALMRVLAPHGVTNQRLDEVSNYYRFRPQNGELWPTKPARGHALVIEGQIKKIVITEPGSGYCSPPVVTVKGFPETKFQVTLGFRRDLRKNGSVSAVVVKGIEPVRKSKEPVAE